MERGTTAIDDTIAVPDHLLPGLGGLAFVDLRRLLSMAFVNQPKLDVRIGEGRDAPGKTGWDGNGQRRCNKEAALIL